MDQLLPHAPTHSAVLPVYRGVLPMETDPTVQAIVSQEQLLPQQIITGVILSPKTPQVLIRGLPVPGVTAVHTTGPRAAQAGAAPPIAARAAQAEAVAHIAHPAAVVVLQAEVHTAVDHPAAAADPRAEVVDPRAEAVHLLPALQEQDDSIISQPGPIRVSGF
jgi:hypothetical protein